MTIKIEETEPFKKAVKKEKINKSDIDKLKDELKENPEKGDVIQKSEGLRKVRMAINNSGKRGGARVIYLYLVVKKKIYLVTVYKKAVKDDLSDDDLKIFRKYTTLLKKSEE